MSRPRKDSAQADARGRLICAFWKLLETTRLEALNVRVITAAAGCNRGTFYYHFRDMDDLIQQALSSELFAETMFPRTIHLLATGEDVMGMNALFDDAHSQRLMLLLDRGGIERAQAVVKASIIGAWTHILHPEGGELSRETLTLLSYTISGMLCLILEISQYAKTAEKWTREATKFTPYLQMNSHSLLQQIAAFEGLDAEAVRQALISFDFSRYVETFTGRSSNEQLPVFATRVVLA